MIIYMFQCYSLKSSHPRPLPQSPKDCFIHLCLFCYLPHRVIVTIFLNSIYTRLVQFRSVAHLCLTLCDPMNHSTPGLPVHHQLLDPPKPMSIVSVMPSNHIILCHPLLLLPSIFPSIRVFSNESALHNRWPKHLEFQLQHQSLQ